jgi:hypothetical protein
MKRLGKVLFGVLCMILLFTFSHAAEMQREKVKVGEDVEIAWDPTTTFLINNDPISNPKAVGYFVYISEDVDKKCEKCEKKNEPQNENPRNENRITETVYVIQLLKAGRYFVGVQAVLYKDENMNGEPVGKSTISWSCSEACTNIPFCLEVEQ